MSSLPRLRLAGLLTVVVLLLAGCAGDLLGSPATGEPPATDNPPAPSGTPPAPSPAHTSPASAGPRQPLSVVTSTTVLADLVRQVGGERVDVSSLMPAGRDPHTFEPAPGDAALLAAADLVVINGLGLDDWLEELAVETAPAVPLVVLGEDLDGVEYLEGSEHEHADEDEHEHAYNPHLWLDVANTRLYVERLAGVLAANDEAGGDAYRVNAGAYDATLASLDDWIQGQLAGLPEQNRRVVSFHDAFPYFGRAYGLEIIGVVVESPGQEPSAAELARLVGEVRAAGVRAVLSEVQFSDQLARVLAEETGIAVVDDLYTDSLGDPPLDGYEAVMRWNTERIVEGLR